MRGKHIDPNELTILKHDILFLIFYLSIAFLVFTFSPTVAWATAPPTPTNLTATAASSRQINLSWKDNATTETNYFVERSPNGSSSWTVIATLGANVTNYQNTGLTQNTTFYYRVRCKAGSTYSSYSNTANTKTATLAAPTALSATVASASQINLSWTDNTTYETNYSVERSPNGSSSWTVIATLGVNVTTYTNTGLTVGTAYYYRVRAYDGTNYSAYSSVVKQTIRTIAASAGSNGAISPSGTVAVANGTSNAFIMTPNTGYKIASVKVDGSAVATNSTYTFSDIAANHTIAATFSANTFTITASTGANGTISPIGAVSVISGATMTITMTPNAGYSLTSLLVDGASVTATSPYVFCNVTANHTISATFTVTVTDVTSPTGSLIINNNAAYTKNPTVTLTLTCSDSGSGCSQMQFSNDNTSWSIAETYATSKSWTLSTGDGPKTVYVKYKDTAGNWTAIIINDTIALDTSSPSVMLTSPVAGFTNNSTPALTYTISDGNVSVKVDGLVVNKVSGNTLDALADGTHTVRVEATDSATNTGSAEVVILVSSNPGIPAISITSPISGATNSRTPLLSYTVSSGVVVIKVDGIIVNKTSGSALDALADGTHTVRVEALNALGNTYFAEIAFTVDTEPPISAKTLKQIAAGANNSAAISADGSLFTWGDNWAGELGNGTVSTSPQPVPGAIGTDRSWAIISVGNSYNLALKSDGTLWAWGYNDNGQLGDGTTVRKYIPIQIGTDSDWKSVSTSGFHSLALKKDGTLWAWGANWSGQVGDGSTTDKYVPVRIGTDSDWAAIVAGGDHSAALKQNGTLWAWGANWAGQVGDGSTTDKYAPIRIGTASNWIAISAGAMHSVALKSDGSLWTWGYNMDGELGDGTTIEKHVPTRIGTENGWSRVSCGDTHVIALKSDSTLWAWGYNYDGELGDGTTVDRHAPVRIGTGNTLVSIEAGSYYSFALKTDSTLWAWGDNASGELGDGTTQNRKSPANIASFGNMLVINNGANSTNDTLVTLALNAWDATSGVAFMRFSNDGTTWSASEAYAATKSWMLGSKNGTKTIYAMFQDAAGNWSNAYSSSILLSVGPTIVSIASPTAGFTQSNTPVLSFTINKGDTVNTVKVDNVVVNKVSGNMLAALADGVHTVRVEAVDVNGILGFVEVSFTVDSVPPSVTITSPIGLTNNSRPMLNYTVNKANTTSIVKVDNITVNTVSGAALDILPDGTHRLRVEAVDAYGYTTAAEATFTVDTEPPAGAIAVRFKSMDAGGNHSAAIARDGTLWAWGSGLLGDRTSVSKILPTLIGTDTDWAAVSAGTQHTGAIKSDGSLWTWGSRYNGRLGIGPTMDIYVPTRVGTDTDWTVISAGGDHTAAIKSDRTLWTWGSNSAGQLGNHDYTWNDQWVPVQVGYSGNIAVSAGDAHTVALDANGTIWVTGSGLYGQLGREADPPYYYQQYFSAMVPYTDWAAVSAGEIHTAAIKTDGTLWAWGNGVYTPTQIGTDSNWTAVSAGWGHTLALKSDGTLWAWGSNPYGQLGDGTTVDKSAPIRVGNDTDWIAVSAGGYDALVNNDYFNDGGYSLALKSDGTLWAWGINSSGQLGDGTTQNHLTPQQVNANLGSGNPILINNGAAAANSASVILTLSAWDMVSGTAFMKFSNDGTTWTAPETYATTKAWTLSPGDGSKTVSVKFQDNAGNWSPVYSASIVLDTVAPTVSIASPTAGTTNNKTPMLTYTVSSGTVVVKVDGVVVTKVSGETLGPLSDNTHTVRVEATNAVGTGFAEVTFTVDTIAPRVTITTPSVGLTNNRTPMLTYTVGDGTVVVKVDGNEVNKVSGNTLDALSDGSHTVRVEATDAVNNTGFATVTFTVDTVAPTVSITSPSGYTNSNDLLLIYTVSDGAAVVKVDGNSVNKVSGDTLDALTNGDHTVRVEAGDAANNLGFAEVTFTADTSSAGNDDTNIYCMGTGTYRVGYSNFTGNISVPVTNNEVWIASPLNYSTIYGPRTIIKGAMDTTIPVNTISVLITNSTGSTSYLAQVNGKYFAAQLSLSAGDNTITVTATDQNSAQHQASVIVNNVIESENVELQAAPSVGIPTLKQSNRTTLDVFLASTASIQYPVANYAWDFNGTGANSLTCYSHSNVTASYEQVGLYLTTVTVTDTAGNHYTDKAIVNVVDKVAIDALLQAQWQGMKSALIANDIQTAMSYFATQSQAQYSSIFTALGSSLSTMAQGMQNISMIYLREGVAKYRIRRIEVAGEITYYIYFIQDENGQWKILQF